MHKSFIKLDRIKYIPQFFKKLMNYCNIQNLSTLFFSFYSNPEKLRKMCFFTYLKKSLGNLLHLGNYKRKQEICAIHSPMPIHKIIDTEFNTNLFYACININS